MYMGSRPHAPDASCRVETVRLSPTPKRILEVQEHRDVHGVKTSCPRCFLQSVNSSPQSYAQENPGSTGASGCTWGQDLMPPILPVQETPWINPYVQEITNEQTLSEVQSVMKFHMPLRIIYFVQAETEGDTLFFVCSFCNFRKYTFNSSFQIYCQKRSASV